MKKLSLIIASLLMIAFMVSCEKESINDDQNLLSGEEMSALKAKPAFLQSPSDPSDQGVIPVIIEGANNGGNVTCAEVELYFEEEGYNLGVLGIADYFLCGDKVDYSEGDGFPDEFPTGLNVTVNEETKTLSFFLDEGECIQIGDGYYKVGAVIVKGGPAANVYFYENGILSDGNLTAPNGKMISNVTFCFAECEEEEEQIIAIKIKYYTYSGNNPEMSTPFGQYWATSVGTYILASSEDASWYPWCHYLGTNILNDSEIVLFNPRIPIDVGSASVTIGDNLNVNIILNDNFYLFSTHIFIGTNDELINLADGGCPNYEHPTEWIVNTYSAGIDHTEIDILL